MYSLEVERKYLVRDDSYQTLATSMSHIRQGYLRCAAEDTTIRLRLIDDHAYLTIKGACNANGLSRSEWEYPIPYAEALAMLEQLPLSGVIDKERYYVPHEGQIWEVDHFLAPHEGLTIAEIELPPVDTPINFPPWLGEEVTGDARYYNAVLAQSAQLSAHQKREIGTPERGAD